MGLVTGDKTLGLAWFLDLPLISSLNEAPPKVLVELRDGSADRR